LTYNTSLQDAHNSILNTKILNNKIKNKDHKVRDKDRGLGKGKEKGYFVEFMPEHLLDSPEFIEVWTDWIEHREERRKKLTSVAARRQLALLGKYPSEVAVAMIDRSIISSWQGIFELPIGHPLLNDSTLADPGATKGDTLRSIR